MSINTVSKRRASQLIESEFQARRNQIAGAPSEDEIAQEINAIVSKAKMGPKIVKLEAALKTVALLKKELSESAQKLRKVSKSKSSRYDNCECHENYRDILKEVAAASLQEKLKSDEKRRQILATERKLLARIEVAQNDFQLQNVLRDAGLL